MLLHIFNPENDLALADGGANYCPPPAATHIARDLAALPLWFAGSEELVFLPSDTHRAYYKEVDSVFDIAQCYGHVHEKDVTGFRPWGWSAQMKRRIKAMGFNVGLLPADEVIENIRALSNRWTSIALLEALAMRGVDVPPLPVYLTTNEDVAAFVESVPLSVVKAPWSGSGKGIMWGLGRVEVPLENFYKGVIRRQGGVVCEHFLSSVQEFAMEFLATENGVQFTGYSLFNSVKGSYSGNILAPDDEIEQTLSQYIPLCKLREVRSLLLELLTGKLRGSGYNGYLGVDMMIYRDECGNLRLNPCMEVNMRMNMGVASRIIYDRHVCAGKRGQFFVNYYKKEGDAYEEHRLNKERYPLEVENGRVAGGYINLSPITPENRYSVYIIIDK